MKQISIGQFSKLSGLSIRALRLYDAEQLLEPSWVDPNTGYRYYTHDQVQRANLIRRLRSTEMPLEQIQVVLRDGQTAETQLRRHRHYLERRLRDHQEMLRTLDGLLEQSGELEVKFRFISAQPVLTICEPRRVDLQSLPTASDTAFGALYRFIQSHAVVTAGAPLITYTLGNEARGANLRYGVPIVGYPPVSDPIERAELPAAELAYIVHQGAYEALGASLERLLGWVSDNKLTVNGPVRQIFLEHPQSVSEAEKYRTELAVPVQRANRR